MLLATGASIFAFFGGEGRFFLGQLVVPVWGGINGGLSFLPMIFSLLFWIHLDPSEDLQELNEIVFSMGKKGPGVGQ